METRLRTRAGRTSYLPRLLLVAVTLLNAYMFSRVIFAPNNQLLGKDLVAESEEDSSKLCVCPEPVTIVSPAVQTDAQPNSKSGEPQYCPYYPEEFAKSTKTQRLTKQCSLNSNRGGWCLKASTRGLTFGKKNKTLAQFHVPVHAPWADKLAHFFGNDDIVDFGAGLGQYGDHFESIHRSGGYKAFDGAANVDEFTKGFVTYADLTKPIIRTADWVLSLEVGEHIPQQYEMNFITNLIRNARKGIVLSWAVPGQAGHSHVNLKSNSDLIGTISAFDFRYDNASSTELRKGVGPYKYFKNSVMVFRRNSFNKDNMW